MQDNAHAKIVDSSTDLNDETFPAGELLFGSFLLPAYLRERCLKSVFMAMSFVGIVKLAFAWIMIATLAQSRLMGLDSLS